MRKKNKPLFNFILSISLAAVLVGANEGGMLIVEASSVGDIKNKIEEDQRLINELYKDRKSTRLNSSHM